MTKEEKSRLKDLNDKIKRYRKQHNSCPGSGNLPRVRHQWIPRMGKTLLYGNWWNLQEGWWEVSKASLLAEEIKIMIQTIWVGNPTKL